MKRVLLTSRCNRRQNISSSVAIKAHGVAEVISEYNPEHVDYMHQLYIELFKELTAHFSDESYTPRISDIKEEWKDEALRDGMMSEEDFDVVYKSLADELMDLLGVSSY